MSILTDVHTSVPIAEPDQDLVDRVAAPKTVFSVEDIH